MFEVDLEYELLSLKMEKRKLECLFMWYSLDKQYEIEVCSLAE